MLNKLIRHKELMEKELVIYLARSQKKQQESFNLFIASQSIIAEIQKTKDEIRMVAFIRFCHMPCLRR